MERFKDFVKEDEDVAKTLSKIPKHHQKLVKGYKFLFEPHNTLKGDDGHVGMVVNKPDKVIRIAAPWRWGREFVLLHEIAHLVFELYVKGKPEEKEWTKLCMSEPKRKKDESAEELFCHAYAAKYSKFPPAIHNHPEWFKFIEKVSKIK